MTTQTTQYQNVSILDLLELRIMEVVVTTGAIRRVKKAPVKTSSSPSTHQYPTFYRLDALAVTQPVSEH